MPGFIAFVALSGRNGTKMGTQNGFTLTESYILGPGGQQMTEMAWSGGTATWEHTNVWAAGSLIATYSLNGSQTVLNFHFTDWLGTRRALTDYAGTVVQSCASLPFGNGENCPTTPTEHLFTGKERDQESGNDYFEARYYASTMGRFLSPDPMMNSGRPDDPQTWNRYSYAFDNPLRIADPSGLYNLPAGCLQNRTCAVIAARLKSGEAALNKALNDPKIAKALGAEGGLLVDPVPAQGANISQRTGLRSGDGPMLSGVRVTECVNAS